ncbi:MAG: CRISPR-associated endonuclease Cas2 [Anaerolineae bacterium]|nr:CRISPR-associated endonuclease Cas2 [Anaerolineae bacterium]
MHVILLYDITSDRIRNKVADECLNFGLDRTQYSAFIGELSRNHQEMLMLKLTALLGDSPGALLLVPVCGTDWERRFEVRNDDATDSPVESGDLPPSAPEPPAPLPERDPDGNAYPF